MNYALIIAVFLVGLILGAWWGYRYAMKDRECLDKYKRETMALFDFTRGKQ